MSDEPTCANCVWGMAKVGGTSLARPMVVECRRFPQFIEHRPDDACGEHPTKALAARVTMARFAAQMEKLA